MMNSKDIEIIERDIAEIIDDWSEPIQIWNLAPIDQQPGWNPLLREIDGDPVYDKILNVPASRLDMYESKLETDNAGSKYKGYRILSIPLSYTVYEDSLIVFENDVNTKWRIESLSRKVGEIILRVFKMVGDS